MDWQTITNNWQLHRANFKQTFPQVHEAELEVAAGNREILADKLRDAMSITQEAAEAEVDNWAKSIQD